MTRAVVLCLASLNFMATCAAQDLHPCKFSEASNVGQQRRHHHSTRCFNREEAKGGATILVPDSKEPLPGVAFTHSAIHGPSNDADLLRFAWALARAGAAAIILDGTIEWQTPNDDSIRPREFQFCAGQWLFQHVNLDLHRLANAGTSKGGWVPNGLSSCGVEMSGKAACWPGGLWLDFGQTGQAESHNTDLMLTPKGQLWMARVAQKQLKLKEIDPDWLTEPAKIPSN